MGDFVNIMSKNVYYKTAKDRVTYQMISLIYDVKFKSEEKTTLTVAWISYPNLLPIFYVKESLFFYKSDN